MAYLFFIQLISFLFLLALPLHITQSLEYSNPNYFQPPNIQLASYTQADAFRKIIPDTRFQVNEQFEDDFISKDNTDYVVSSEIRTVTFTCAASYPITWHVSRAENSLGNFFPSEIRNSYLDSNMTSPEIPNFTISLTVLFNSAELFFGANLTCISINKGNQNITKSEVYIFYEGTSRIEHEGEIISIYVDPKTFEIPGESAPTLILPCRPSSPQIPLKLEIEKGLAPWDTPVSEISWTSYMSYDDRDFDPKIGFSIDAAFFGHFIYSLYRCSVLQSVNGRLRNDEAIKIGEYVIFNVTNTPENGNSGNEVMSYKPHSTLHGTAIVQVKEHSEQPYASSDIICCSGVADKPPQIYTNRCNNPLHCEMMAKLLASRVSETSFQNNAKQKPIVKPNRRSDCSQQTLFESTAHVVICKGINVNYLETFVSLFQPYAGASVKRRSNLTNGSPSSKSLNHGVSLTKHVALSSAMIAPLAEKVIILVGRKSDKQPHRLNGMHFMGAFVDSDTDYVVETLIDGEEDIWQRIKSTMHIEEYDRDVYYEGEPLVFVCFGVKYFHTAEPQLRVNWANGRKSVLKADTENVTEFRQKLKQRIMLYLHDNNYMFNRNGFFSVNKFSETVMAKQGMTSIDCWMPKRESSSFDKISKPLQILPSVAPRFEEKEEDTLYFYLGDEGHIVICTVVEGLPRPKLTITRNRMPLIVNLHHNSKTPVKSLRATQLADPGNHLGTVSILFPKIAHEHQIVLKCIAENANGTVTRTIRVFVIEHSGNAVPILRCVMGTLVSVLVGLVLRRLYNRGLPLPARKIF